MRAETLKAARRRSRRRLPIGSILGAAAALTLAAPGAAPAAEPTCVAFVFPKANHTYMPGNVFVKVVANRNCPDQTGENWVVFDIQRHHSMNAPGVTHMESYNFLAMDKQAQAAGVTLTDIVQIPGTYRIRAVKHLLGWTGKTPWVVFKVAARRAAPGEKKLYPVPKPKPGPPPVRKPAVPSQ